MNVCEVFDAEFADAVFGVHDGVCVSEEWVVCVQGLVVQVLQG